jgi:hypothetical protein
MGSNRQQRAAKRYGWRRTRQMSTDDELVERVRTLRTQGCTPKQIARTVGVPAARVTALVRAIAAEQSAADPHRLVGCWVSPQWSGGLTVTGHPEWPDVDFDRSRLHGGLASVVVARQERRHRVTVCGYLVDTYCLGLKNAVGPRSMAAGDLEAFVAYYFDAHGEPPLPVGLDLVQHLVFGAVEYARGLGFEPHPDFDLVAGHLGEWTPPSAVTFGRNGQPLYVQGPRDNAASITATLNRAVGQGNYHYVLQTNG